MPQHAQGEGIDQRIALVAFVEADLAGDGGNAKAVAVMGDPGNHPGEQPAHLGIVQFAKTQGVQCGDRTGPHGENVADDAAHASGRTLEGFNGAGMVVGLDLEGDGHAVPDIDDAGILLTRADQNLVPLGGKGLQDWPGVLVGTVLRPHHREDAQFGMGGRPPQDFEDLLVLFRGEVVFGDEFRGDGRFVHQRSGRWPANGGGTVGTRRKATRTSGQDFGTAPRGGSPRRAVMRGEITPFQRTISV